MALLSYRVAARHRYVFFGFVYFSLFTLLAGAAALAQSVSFQWDPNLENDLAGYNLYRSLSSGAGYVQLNDNLISEPAYADGDLSGGQTYFYVVTAVNTSGLESEFSNEVSFTAPAQNSSPVATGDSIQILEDQAASIDVLANDTDPDGDPLSVVSVTQGGWDSVSITDSNLVGYVPIANFNGSDSFTYTISDGNGGTATASVVVTVIAVNDPPAAVPDSATTSQDQAVAVSVLDNDSDIDGETLTISQVTLPSNGTAAIQPDAAAVLYTPNPGFFGTDSFSYEVSDGKGGSTVAAVTVTVSASKLISPGLVFPNHLSSSDKFLNDSFISAAILNPQSQPEVIELSEFTEEGVLLNSNELPNTLEPKEQTAFLVSSLSQNSLLPAVLTAYGKSGPIQGICMVGNSGLSRLDGLASEIPVSRTLHFPIAQQSPQRSTLIFLYNPASDPAERVSLKLFDSDGGLRNEIVTSLQPQGFLKATLSELFGTSGSIAEGYVKVETDTPVKGFEMVAGRNTFSLLSGQIDTSAEKLRAAHFAVDKLSSNSILRVLNTGTEALQVTMRAFNDSSELLAQKEVSLESGHLLVEELRSLLSAQSNELQKGQTLTGFLELEIQSLGPSEPRVSGSLTFTTNRGATEATLPLISEGRLQFIFPHIAQSVGSGIFTGLAILNPGSESSEVRVEVFDDQGNATRQKRVLIPAASRISGLLNSATFFGSQFEQVNGHIRLTATQPVIPFAFFGDFKGTSLSAIEGQQPK